MANYPQEKLTYLEFQKTILDFQLSEHEKFLHDFTELFKHIDKDRNGSIDEEEFKELMGQMRVLHREEEEVVLLLQMIDPYNNQKMTYSEVVHLLSSHMVSAYDDDDVVEDVTHAQMTSVLEKFVNIRTGGSYLELRGALLNQSQNSRKGG